MSEGRLSVFGSQVSLSPSIFSPTSYSIIGEDGMDGGNIYHVLTALISRVLFSQDCLTVARPLLECSQYEYFEKEFVAFLFDALLKCMHAFYFFQ